VHPADESPVLLVVGPDQGRREALARDLEDRYGADTVLMAATAGDALALLASARPPVALVIAESHLDDRTGPELLDEVRRRHPIVSRVLVAASYLDSPQDYDETDLRAWALESGGAQAVVTRPWRPPEERLYPHLDDLLADWRAAAAARPGALVLISEPSSARGNEMRDLLARNGLSFDWHPPDSAEGQEILRARGLPDPGMRPVMLLHDGTVLVDPTVRQAATALGALQVPDRDVHDLVIVGSGPAGLAAAVYGASEGLSTLLLESVAIGGQAGTSARIENYPGFPAGISGTALMSRAGLQAGRLGARALVPRRASRLERTEGGVLAVHTDDGEIVRGRAVVLALGVEYRRLGVAGVERLVGAGVHYGSPTVELPGVRDGRVYIVGGGNSAGQAAVRMADTARSVTLLVRGPSPSASMSRYLAERIGATPTISVLTQVRVVGATGGDRLEGLRLRDSFGDVTAVPADALFVMIGAEPRTDWLPAEIRRDALGYLLTGPDLGTDPADPDRARSRLPLETSMSGVFAVGDVRHRSLKRVAAAVGDGATVVSSVQAYLSEAAGA
jgi:thioredoxin reductase (NADPH)